MEVTFQMFRSFRAMLADPETKWIAVAASTTIAVGTVAYVLLEHWSPVDSFYFCAVTLTTIGYGDLHPTTDLGKIFTIFYCVAGIGIVTTFVSNLAARTAVRIQQRVERRMSERSNRSER